MGRGVSGVKQLILILSFLMPAWMQAQHQFPDSWEGNWEGMMHIYRQNQIMDSVQMNFEIHPTDNDSVWTWKATYLTDIPDSEKDYLLVLVDAETGEYAIDEQDGIVLKAWLSGSTVTSIFRVNDMHLFTRYEKIGDYIHFEVQYGDAPSEGEGVTSGVIGGKQSAVLQRVP